MKIITLSGLDGSGKSTQIKLLKNYLEKQGKKVFYFHAVDFSIGNKIIFWKHKKNKKTGTGVAKSGWLGIQLRKIALQIDIWRFKKLVKKLEKQNYDYILSDRFFYDIVANIEYLSNKSFQFSIFNFQLNSDKQKNNYSKIFQYLPFNQNLSATMKSKLLTRRQTEKNQNILSIYLQTDPEEIMKRDRVPEQGTEYLKKKKKILDDKSATWKWKVVNGNRSVEEIFSEIKNIANFL